jgi:Fic family protein
MVIIGYMLKLKSIPLTQDIVKLIAEIDEFKGAWSALERHSTALNLIGDFANFGQNFKAITDPWKNRPLDTDMLLKLHKSLGGADGGVYKLRAQPLIIQNGDKIFGSLDTATPDECESLTHNLMGWLEKTLAQKDVHPLLAIGLFAAIFLQIAPFETGNQKLPRLMIILLLIKSGYTYTPYVSLDEIWISQSRACFAALKDLQDSIEAGQPKWEPWLMFFLTTLKAHKDRLKDRMERKGGDMAKMPALSAKVMTLFRQHQRLQMKEIERLTRGRRATLKLRLNELVDEGYLKRHGQARSTWYSLV